MEAKTLLYMFSMGDMPLWEGLYRKENIYGEYRESQDTQAFRRCKKGQANSGEAEKRERQEEMGKTRHTFLFFVWKGEVMILCSDRVLNRGEAGESLAMSEGNERRTAWGGVGASSLGPSFWEPFSMTAVTHCMNQWDNPQLPQTVLLPLTNLPEHTLSKTGLSGSQQVQWFCAHGCEISFHCWVAFFSTVSDSLTGVSSRRNHHMKEWRLVA